MALCLAESLLTKQKFSHLDQLERYNEWYENGHLSSNGKCFDIGMTCCKNMLANLKHQRNYGPSNKNQSGNGCIMRLAPVPLFYSFDIELALEMSAESSRTTHHSEISMDCCRYFSGLIIGSMNGASKEELLSEKYSPIKGYWNDHEMCEELEDIALGYYKQKESKEISNSGYVIPALEAALWGFYNSNNFKDGLLKVVNLGDDSDTVGAIYGQIAGAYYGFEDIPKDWVDKIALSPLIKVYSEELKHLSDQSSKKQELKNSTDFIECQKSLVYLESGYQRIMRKSDPGPSRFKSFELFEEEVDQYQKSYLDLVNDYDNHDLAAAMWKEFEFRINQQDRPRLKHYFELKQVGPPPGPPPMDGNLNPSNTKKESVDQDSVNELLESIRKLKKE